MAKKYIKNREGVVSAITTDNLQLEKPLLNENYDIEVHNRNMDKIDSAIQEDKSNISSLKTKVDNGQNRKLTQDDGRYIQTKDTGNIDNPVLGWFNYFNAKGTLPSGYNANDNDFLIENKGVGPDWIRQILYDVRSEKTFERMRLNGTWKDWRCL